LHEKNIIDRLLCHFKKTFEGIEKEEISAIPTLLKESIHIKFNKNPLNLKSQEKSLIQRFVKKK